MCLNQTALFKYRALQCVTLMLGVYRFLREASAADKLSVLQFTHMAWRTLEDTPVFLLRPCKCVWERHRQGGGTFSAGKFKLSLSVKQNAQSANHTHKQFNIHSGWFMLMSSANVCGWQQQPEFTLTHMFPCSCKQWNMGPCLREASVTVTNPLNNYTHSIAFAVTLNMWALRMWCPSSIVCCLFSFPSCLENMNARRAWPLLCDFFFFNSEIWFVMKSSNLTNLQRRKEAVASSWFLSFLHIYYADVFQIKHILKMDKDTPSKFNMQFLNDFIYSG